MTSLDPTTKAAVVGLGAFIAGWVARSLMVRRPRQSAAAGGADTDDHHEDDLPEVCDKRRLMLCAYYVMSNP